MTEHLFIGGSKDGEWIEVEDNKHTYEVVTPVREVGPTHRVGGMSFVEEITSDWKHEWYFRRSISCDTMKFSVFALGHLEWAEIFQHILELASAPHRAKVCAQLSQAGKDWYKVLISSAARPFDAPLPDEPPPPPKEKSPYTPVRRTTIKVV